MSQYTVPYKYGKQTVIFWGRGACNSHNNPVQRHFTDQSIFRRFSREIGQFQSTWARFGEDKTMRPHVNMSTCEHDCYWSLRFMWGSEFEINLNWLKIDRSVKTPWQEYGVVAGSWWWAPCMIHQAVVSSRGSILTCFPTRRRENAKPSISDNPPDVGKCNKELLSCLINLLNWD